MQDETIVRLFPNMRRAWSPQGRQAPVGISGHNAQRCVSCTLDLQTGGMVIRIQKRNNAVGFQELLRHVRRRYGKRPVVMLLDGFSGHRAKATRHLADDLNIILLELPRQCPELNAVDQLWKHVKDKVSSNQQYCTIEQHAEAVVTYVKQLTLKERLKKAGVFSDNFWLRNTL